MNLDPHGRYSDEELWRVADEVRILSIDWPWCVNLPLCSVLWGKYTAVVQGIELLTPVIRWA